MSFSKNLRYVMDSKGIQTKELSSKTGISENTIKSYLKSDFAEPNVSKALMIAKALNVSVEFLVTGVDNCKNKQKTTLELNITNNLSKLSERDLTITASLITEMIKNNAK